MTVAFDAATESIRTGTTDPWAFNHTPAGTPRAVVVACMNYTTATDQIVGITYGGVALTEVIRRSDAGGGEATDTQLWFLGSGVLTGTQSVSIDLASATGDDFMFVCVTLTAAGNCAVQDSDGVAEDAANPQVTLQYGGKSCLSICALAGGLPNVTDYTLVASCSAVHDNDSGNEIQRVDRQTTAGTTDFTIGYTSASDDVSFCALAITDDLAQTVTPSSIAVGSALGTPTTVRILTVAPTAIAAGSALGAPTTALALTKAVTGIGPGAALGAPSLALALSKAVTAIPSGAVIGTPTISQSSTQTVTPASITAGSALGVPTVALAISKQMTGVGPGSALGVPTVALTLTRSVSGIASGAALGVPGRVLTLAVHPGGVASSAALGVPTIMVPYSGAGGAATGSVWRTSVWNRGT